MKNKGVIQYQRQPEDWTFGAIDSPIINESGDWSDYIPVFEHQAKHFQTMACCSFSALNVLEILYKYKYGVEKNWSDRFTAKVSGTNSRGNTFKAVADAIRHYGLIDEELYPMVNTWNEYYKEVPQELLDKGKDFLINHEISYWWVFPNKENLKDALKRAPLQVGVKLGGFKIVGDKIIYTRTTGFSNHAVSLIKMTDDWYKIFDHDDRDIKYLAPNFDIQYVYLYSIIKKNMKFLKEKNSSAVYLIKGNEAIPINDAQDYLNLEVDFSAVEEVDTIKQTKVNKKLYTFIR